MLGFQISRSADVCRMMHDRYLESSDKFLRSFGNSTDHATVKDRKALDLHNLRDAIETFEYYINCRETITPSYERNVVGINAIIFTFNVGMPKCSTVLMTFDNKEEAKASIIKALYKPMDKLEEKLDAHLDSCSDKYIMFVVNTIHFSDVTEYPIYHPRQVV